MIFISTNRELQAQLDEISAMTCGNDNVTWHVVTHRGDKNAFSCRDNVLDITYLHKSYVFRAVGCVAAGKTSGEETSSFNRLGVMLDCSRNGVYTVDAIKRLIRYMAVAGYNFLQLYTEDLYKIDGEPYFGYMRGAYDKSDIKVLDSYAASFGVELVPCIQTLAHLGAIFRWKPYAELNDVNDILLVDYERTYALIDKMFSTVAECFSSRNINIGMDEAFMLGYGKYRTLHGDVDRVALMQRHVRRVLDIAAKYGFSCSMWSDMYYRLAYGGYYDGCNKCLPQKVSNSIPQDVGLIYWDYYSKDKAHFEKILAQHKLITQNVWFAGALWSFLGNLPNNAFTIQGARASIEACKAQGVKNALFAMWGDNGAECPMCGLLPSLFAIADIAYGANDEKIFDDRSVAFCGVPYAAFEDAEFLDKVGAGGEELACPAKYLLYNDCFAGVLDTTVAIGDEREYLRISKRLAEYVDGRFGTFFAYAKSLADVLTYKATLGIKTRELYKHCDKTALCTLAEDEYTQTIERLKVFYDAAKRIWEEEKKQNGFEVIDYRIGGLIARVEHCKQMLLDYCHGKLDKIDQLEEELLDYYGNGNEFQRRGGYINEFVKIATVNNF